MKKYISRTCESAIKKASATMPIIAITGPRQSGKTTLAKHLFADFVYYNLEFPDVRVYAESDPRGFLSQSQKMIIDEIQRVPVLFSYIQGLTDEDKKRKFILTGSNNFTLMHKISQSMAGRIAIFTVLPFSQNEISDHIVKDLDEVMYHGMYPRVISDRVEPSLWYASYIQTYLERDVREMSAVQSLDTFYSFLRVIALRIGSVVNYADIAREVGVTAKTIREWISLLTISYIVFNLPPFHKNLKRRLTKSPKLYFYDTGLLCALLGITNAEQVRAHPNVGMIFESFVISEKLKNAYEERKECDLYFYRDHEGIEIDLLIANKRDWDLFEIKLNKAFSPSFLKNMQWFADAINGVRSQNVIYGGELTHKIINGKLIGWRDAGVA